VSVLIRFEDITHLYVAGYRFSPMRSFAAGWPVVPRVSDVIYDANEMRYAVKEVGWWGPDLVTVKIERVE
jgi:hypothetical protein